MINTGNIKKGLNKIISNGFLLLGIAIILLTLAIAVSDGFGGGYWVILALELFPLLIIGFAYLVTWRNKKDKK